MTVEGLIAKLKSFNGKLTVVVYDGSDPSDLVEVSKVKAEEFYFFPARNAFGCEKLVVRLT